MIAFMLLAAGLQEPPPAEPMFESRAVYCEMMAHVPILTHPHPKSVLIVGGGDGGLLSEVLRHESLEKVIQVEDAAQFVKETPDRFDVILIDSKDPEEASFYGNCKRILNPGGILVNQNRAPHFKHTSVYVLASPTSTGGLMALGWASDKKYSVSLKTLEQRLSKIAGPMRYYTPAIHKASFSLPAFMLDQPGK